MYAEAKFWDRMARKYARDPIKNMTAYEATLERVRARLQPDNKVLEVGCGTGSTAMLLAGDVADYTGADVSGEMVAIAREKLAETPIDGLEFTVAPANETRFDPESYDAILGFNLLHLLDNLPGAIARARVLLKPGGLYITKSPCLGDMGFHMRLLLPVMKLFYRVPFLGVFKRQELEREIEKAGFEIIETRVFDGAPHARYIVAQKV